jgi:hypothetical protein
MLGLTLPVPVGSQTPKNSDPDFFVMQDGHFFGRGTDDCYHLQAPYTINLLLWLSLLASS